MNVSEEKLNDLLGKFVGDLGATMAEFPTALNLKSPNRKNIPARIMILSHFSIVSTIWAIRSARRGTLKTL